MMSVQFVFLWSDALLWLLLIAACGLGVVSLRVAHLRAGWQRLGKNGVAMAMVTWLTVFLIIGFLDSIHYRLPLPKTETDTEQRYSVEVLSVLDALTEKLHSRYEKTYSAPLATRLYVMETVETATHVERVYPRLVHGGAHLGEQESDRAGDVLVRIAWALSSALLIWLAVAAAITHCVQRKERGTSFRSTSRRIWRGETPFAWRGVLLALVPLLLVAFPILFLAGDYHVFGTDKVGQDVLYQVLKSIRTALVIGLVTTFVMLPLAVLLGIVAGYFRGWVDDAIQYIYTVLNAVPGVLLIAAAVLMMQVVIDTHPQWFSTAAERADLRLVALCAILGMTSWTSLARLLRGETLKLRELEYIAAARAFGVSSRRILLRHILPNLMHIVVIALVMDFSSLVLAEAVLSYVGIGVDPTMTSFGGMINNARMELSREPAVWWSLAAAFTFMLTLVLSANLFADAVRDAFDPRQ